VLPALPKLTNLRLEHWILGVLLLGSCGCANFVDQVTDRQFKFKDLWSRPPDPLTVLAESSDAAKRGQALANLHNPLLHGGTQEMHDRYLDILITKATKNPPPKGPDPANPWPSGIDPDLLQPLIRLGAIRALGEYTDERAAKALEEVYWGYTKLNGLSTGASAGTLPFVPEMNSKIKMQALAALEKTGSPVARHLFITQVLTPGPAEATTGQDSSQTIDEKLACLRGLARFRDNEVLATLVRVLETEKNIAVRDRAHMSLKAITGKNLPQDAIAWRNLVQNSPRDAYVQEPSAMQRLLNFMAH